MKEEWKDIYFVDKGIIYDYRGLYQISNYGRVKSLPRNGTIKKERIKKPKKNKYGYLSVQLSKNNQTKFFLVHRLVANLFISNPNNLPQVNHINGIKDDCRLENLEWITASGNTRHAFYTELHSIPKGKNNWLSKQVVQYDKQGNFIKKWGSIREVEGELGIKNQAIIACCKNKPHHNTAGGYIWRYAYE